MPLRQIAARVLDSLADRLVARLEARLPKPEPVVIAPAPVATEAPAPAPPTGFVIELDYPVEPKPRWGRAWGMEGHPQLEAVIRADDALVKDSLAVIARYRNELRKISEDAGEATEPNWVNGWVPGWDGAALYAFVADRKPKVYMEVGSGNSTKFVRRAINDHGLSTRIVSIDPFPRAEIDSICDEVVRHPLENVDLSIFDQLGEGDVCFIDNSHRSFQNSDVTVSFLQILPRLKPGVLIGFHDIFLPDDYPQDWANRYYSEQYLLATFLLGGHKGTRVFLPAFDASRRPELNEEVNDIWNVDGLRNVELHGGAFWLLTV